MNCLSFVDKIRCTWVVDVVESQGGTAHLTLNLGARPNSKLHTLGNINMYVTTITKTYKKEVIQIM